MRNGKREIFMKAIRGEATERPSIACVNQTGTYEQMEALGVKWPDANFDADLMARLAIGAHTILDFDAVRVPFCQTIEEEALGCGVLIGDDKNLPSIATHPYDIGMTPHFPEDFLDRGRVKVLCKALKKVKEEVGGEVAVMGGVIGPFTIVGELIGINDFLIATLKNPKMLHEFLRVATKAATQLARALLDAGADAICIEDMLASMDMISPAKYKELAWPWEEELTSRISSAPVILHICGRVNPIIKHMIATGATALSFEPKTDVTAVKQAIKEEGKQVGIIGGIATMEDLFFGDPEKAKSSALRAAEEGYNVIAPGCSIPPGTTTETLRAMLLRETEMLGG
ncbi:MAG: MtaA/CmuA family methyltransferase [Alphaproteobacteria bacterium]|uniref:MtaA/CmuA family methyltransferase n=1 Tax=Candidatus Nitrobium versatile TaxID=2884831 RepID=A0A953SIC4_9BACT|nr:MtaA/CmuA family methyltransferase [Candidatus Nitrobium versatile]